MTVATVEQLHRVHGASARLGPKQPGADLHHASWVSGRDDVGIRLLDVLELAVEDDIQRLRLYQIVNGRGALAHIALGKRNELELGNGA